MKAQWQTVISPEGRVWHVVDDLALILREQEPAALINADEAAQLLGITRDALYMRVSRGQVPGVVRTGRRTQFLKDKLVSGLERRSSK